MRRPKLMLEAKIVDERGCVYAARAIDLPDEAAYIGERAVDEIKAGVFWDPSKPSPLEAVCHVMQTRELRKSAIVRLASNLGAMLSDYLCDREGWNGLDRQEATKEDLQRRFGPNTI